MRAVISFLSLVCTLTAGLTAAPAPAGRETITVPRVTGTIRADGKMDEPEWALAPAYSLGLPLKAHANLPDRMLSSIGGELHEKGTVRLLRDDDYLYVGVQMDDSDVMNAGNEDQGHLYSTGDVVEVFIGPSDKNYYWEIYGAPNNRKSWFFFPSRGRVVFPLCGDYKPLSFQAGASVSGTLNNWTDRDRGWCVELAIPIKELTALGDGFNSQTAWRVLIARYNYSAFLQEKELSSFPILSNPSFHLYEEYARLGGWQK